MLILCLVVCKHQHLDVLDLLKLEKDSLGYDFLPKDTI